MADESTTLAERFKEIFGKETTPLLAAASISEDYKLDDSPFINFDRSMYNPSLIMKKIQFLLENNIVRIWNDDILQTKKQLEISDGDKLNKANQMIDTTETSSLNTSPHFIKHQNSHKQLLVSNRKDQFKNNGEEETITDILMRHEINDKVIAYNTKTMSTYLFEILDKLENTKNPIFKNSLLQKCGEFIGMVE